MSPQHTLFSVWHPIVQQDLLSVKHISKVQTTHQCASAGRHFVLEKPSARWGCCENRLSVGQENKLL